MSLLKESDVAEINGTSGRVKQGDLVIQGAFTPEIDWTYLYVYDRGFELDLGGIPVYAEPTLDGLFVYLDDEISVEDERRIEVEARRIFHSAPVLVKGDKRIWFREWRRFNQLKTVTFLHSQFAAAIAAWDKLELRQTIELFKKTASAIPRPPTTESSVARLFWAELGAALHASVAVEVEGYSLWSSYRDSATWRVHNGIKFADFVGKAIDRVTMPPRLVEILDCLAILADLRNSAYPFFAERQIFNGDYFGSREALVQQACTELEVLFIDEDASLAALYEVGTFRKLDRQFLNTAFAIFANDGS
jgi:hypothetical protein